MRTLYYQPACGIAGDMHMAAMIDLGVPEALIRSELSRLALDDEFSLEIGRDARKGISGTQVTVHAQAGPAHRHYAEIAERIQRAGFTEGIESRAIAIFDAIARAEASIHDVPIERVHFHEVGAVDSIVDIVAAAICVDHLAPDQIQCATVEVGGGFVDCAHGRYPVPAPATQEILKGAPLSYGGVDGESTTPTGAAILQASVDRFEPPKAFTPQAIGYGVGRKEFVLPNVLRVVLGTTPDTSSATVGTHFKIEANIDDMTPEALEPLIDDLLANGASDAYFTPIVMKKSRPATQLTVLAEPDASDLLVERLLNRSSTIGLRVLPFEKHVLPRELLTIQTRFGEVTIKQVTQPDGRTRWKSEHEDVLRLATQHGLDYQTAKREIDQDITAALDG